VIHKQPIKHRIALTFHKKLGILCVKQC